MGCLEGWIRNGTDCYTLVDTPSPWFEAEQKCSKFGGHLASIKTPEEFVIVREMLLERSTSLNWW